MAINKPRYLRKADFLSYFDRPSQFWYLSNQELEGVFRSYFQQVKTDENVDTTELNDAEADIDEFIEFDPIAFYRDEAEVQLNENSDPRVIEGQIILDEFKKFLIRYCEQIFNIKTVIDFNEICPPEQYTLEERAAKTLEVIKSSVVPTLFLNPVFIYECAIAIPTAITFTNGGYEFFDVKGTTSTKRADVLDLFYQIKIIKHNLSTFRNAFLFLVAYEFKPKFSISFTICETVEITKTNKQSKSAATREAELPFYSSLLIREKQWIKKHGRVNIVDLVDGKYESMTFNNTKVPDHIAAVPKKGKKSDDENSSKNQFKLSGKISKKDEKFVEELIELDKNFTKILYEIKNYEGTSVIDVPISKCYDTYWRKFKYLNVVRKVFGTKWEIFKYSGKLVKWDTALDFVARNNKPEIATYHNWLRYHLNSKIKGFIQQIKETDLNQEANAIDKLSSYKWNESDIIKDWYRLKNQIYSTYDDINYFVSENAHEVITKLKNKKIYFDFETINQALRVMDHSLPFMQIVTQCSVLRDHGSGLESDCENLIVDPKNITPDFFKQIVDALWVENADQYSYVVFNKSFEINRLIEMKSILNDPNYSKKIHDIIDNVYDLADLFNLYNRNIVIDQLKGFHSIKVLLPLVPQKYLDETKTISYSSLNVKRGDRAQALTSLRFFDVIDDAKWKQISHYLCLYCENDVRAMVAVELFAKALINSYEIKEIHNPNLEQLLAFIISANEQEKPESINRLINFLKPLSKSEQHRVLDNFVNEWTLEISKA